jgi:predicted nucleotidyltransferase
MRLTALQISQFKESIKEVGILKFQLFLFGSRTDQTLKGGDIDLLLVVPDENFELAQSKKILIITKMKIKTTDEKIDLTLSTSENLKKDAFLVSISAQMLQL